MDQQYNLNPRLIIYYSRYQLDLTWSYLNTKYSIILFGANESK